MSHPTPNTRRGAAVVEFAIVLPLLLLLILGAVEMGRGVMVQHILEESARAGCRVATMDNPTKQEVLDIVDLAMERARIENYTVTIDPDPPGSATYKDAVIVSVSVPYDEISWLSGTEFLSGQTLMGTCVMPSETGGDDYIPPDDDSKKESKKSKK